VPQHVDVDGDPEAGTLTRWAHNLLCRDGCHGRTTLGHEQVFGCGLLSLQFAQRSQLPAGEWMHPVD
jgi:hypothetical protein